MSKLIKITPIEDEFVISWIMHLRCNYDCMYCPENRHNNNGEMKSLDELKQYWLQIYNNTKHLNKKYKLQLTGGEITINKSFLPFIEFLRTEFGDKISHLGMNTNGSASTNYYLKVLKYVDSISFSTHTEHMDVDKFFATVKACSDYVRGIPKKTCHLNIMDEYWAKEQIEDFVQRCKNDKIFYSMSPIFWQHKTRDHPIFKIKS